MSSKCDFLSFSERGEPGQPDCFFAYPDGLRVYFTIPAADVLQIREAILGGASVAKVKAMVADSKRRNGLTGTLTGRGEKGAIGARAARPLAL